MDSPFRIAMRGCGNPGSSTASPVGTHAVLLDDPTRAILGGKWRSANSSTELPSGSISSMRASIALLDPRQVRARGKPRRTSPRDSSCSRNRSRCLSTRRGTSIAAAQTCRLARRGWGKCRATRKPSCRNEDEGAILRVQRSKRRGSAKVRWESRTLGNSVHRCIRGMVRTLEGTRSGIIRHSGNARSVSPRGRHDAGEWNFRFDASFTD